MDESKKSKKGNATVSITSGDFPLHLFMEWDKDCKENFNDIRWVKMMNDHRAAQREILWIHLLEAIEELDERVKKLEASPKPKEQPEPLTLGGN